MPSYISVRRLFTRAVELDPNFARALAGIAECDCDLYLHFGAQLSVDDVLVTAERARQLEPDLVSAHASRGVALLASDRAEEAERSFQRAIAAEVDYATAHYFYGRTRAILGPKQEAAELIRRAADLAPDDVGF